MDTQLILVEGIPGSGKSSTAQLLCDQVRRNGHRARWYYEEEHPHPVAAERGIGDPDDFQRFSRDVRRRWRTFVRQAQRTGEIVLIDGHFFQDTVGPLLRLDVKPGLIVAHLRAVAEICAPLDPQLVFLYQPDYARTLRRILDLRGERIEQHYIRLVEVCRYGQRLELTGFDGLVRFWTDARTIMERALARLELPHLVIDNSAGRWDDYLRQLCEHFGLELQVDRRLWAPQYLQQFAGTYTYQRQGAPRRIAGEGAVEPVWYRRVGGRSRQVSAHYHQDVEFYIRLEAGELVMHEYGWLWPTNRLVPKERDIFHIASFPFLLEFERDDDGELVSATRTNPTGKWLVTGQQYPRVSEKSSSEGDGD